MKRTNLKIHIIMHASYVTPGVISQWGNQREHAFSFTHINEGEQLPDNKDFDLLIILGGPMSANDEEQFPWLNVEFDFLKECIKARKPILGICLGSQLLAKTLGSTVYKNTAPELGWHSIQKSMAFEHPVKDFFDDTHMTMHWHGDVFDLPTGAIQIACSEHTKCQGFIYADRVVGLQFHPEIDEEIIQNFIKADKHLLNKAPSIQTEEEILSQMHHMQDTNNLLISLLDYLTEE